MKVLFVIFLLLFAGCNVPSQTCPFKYPDTRFSQEVLNIATLCLYGMIKEAQIEESELCEKPGCPDDPIPGPATGD